MAALFLAASPFLYAQEHSYKEMNCMGLIPEDFLPEGAKKLMLNNANDETPKSRKETKLFTKFNLRSNYSAYNCLVSGYVIYGTPLNQYVNRVADKLLEKDPATRKKIKIYLFESSQVNAFTFSNGLVLINIGLFAKLNSEAELAFVLSHEFAHYTRSHAFNAFRKERGVDKESKDVALSVDREEMDYFRFSKEQETEADNLGFVTFMNSGYKLTASISLLEVLARANWPISNKELTRDFLESKYLKIPQKYFNDSTVKGYSVDSSKVDKNQTHPAIPKRKQTLAALMIKNFSDTSVGKLYQISQDDFERFRQQCRMEMPRLYLHEKEYQQSFYASYALMGKSLDDEYLTTMIVKNLYFIQFNFNTRNKNDVIESEKKSEGEVSRFNYMLKNMSKEELNGWCLRKAWDYSTQFPNNEEIQLFTKGITKAFKENVNGELNYFVGLTDYNDSLINSFYQTTVVEEITKQRKSNSDRKSNRIKAKRGNSFVKYCMPDYITDERFKTVYNSIVVKKEDGEEENAEEVKKLAKKKKKDKTEHFKADEIILANFTNIKLDERKSDPVMYTAMKEQTEEMLDIVKSCAKMNDLNVTMLMPEELQTEDSVLFRDRNTILKYLNERVKYEGNDEFYGTDHRAVNEATARYNTKYIAVVSVVGVLLKKDIDPTYVCASVLYPPLAIVSLYALIKPERASYLSFELYDVSTGKKVFTRYKYFNTNSNPDLLKSEFYNLFLKFKGK